MSFRKAFARRASSVGYVAVAIPVLLVGCGVAPVDNVDLSTTQGACEAAETAVRLLQSGSPDDFDAGFELAERVWIGTEDDALVSAGMRRECAEVVFDMLDSSGIPYNLSLP